MKRQIQRALQSWKSEFLLFWGRFNAFQRIVIAIVFAMVLVYIARLNLLDPLKQEFDKVQKTLSDKKIPALIPLPEKDDEIQQDLLRAENLEQSLKNEASERTRMEARTSYRLNAGPADAQAALISLATRSGLRVHENRPVTVETQGVIPHASFVCELRGSLFTSISRFLSAFPSEPYLWELDQISLDLLPQKASASTQGSYQPPVLSLRFLLRFYIYGKETSDDDQAQLYKSYYTDDISADTDGHIIPAEETIDDQDAFEYTERGVDDSEKIKAVLPDRTGESFFVYHRTNSLQNHFIPSGWMGDIKSLSFNDRFIRVVSMETSYIEITYNPERFKNEGWAGIYWQSSENNWGTRNTGYDLTGFNKLIFSAKGARGGEIISKVKAGGITRNSMTGQILDYPDSLDVEKGPIRLGTEWQEYFINLSGKDLSYVNGGLALIFSADHVSSAQTISIGNIRYAYDSDLTVEAVALNFPFYVYAEHGIVDNHFIPSGWMPGSAAKDLRMNMQWNEDPYSGESCIRIEYADNSGIGWAGVAWQEPANNWGSVANAGYDLKGAKKLTFWARGEQGGEMINEFKMGGLINGAHPDSDTASIGPIELTDQWKHYEINLRGKDLSQVIGGFGFAISIENNNPDGVVFYLDEIKYEN